MTGWLAPAGVLGMSAKTKQVRSAPTARLARFRARSFIALSRRA